jgi:hypothetical protein
VLGSIRRAAQDWLPPICFATLQECGMETHQAVPRSAKSIARGRRVIIAQSGS